MLVSKTVARIVLAITVMATVSVYGLLDYNYGGAADVAGDYCVQRRYARRRPCFVGNDGDGVC